MAQVLVQTYAETTPANDHPFTIAGVDLSRMSILVTQVNTLGLTLSQTLTSPAQSMKLYDVYSETQKLDHDSNFKIEKATEGFVDIYDFALRVSQRYAQPDIRAAAHAVTSELQAAVVAELKRGDWTTCMACRSIFRLAPISC
jgi:hypothetical protein